MTVQSVRYDAYDMTILYETVLDCHWSEASVTTSDIQSSWLQPMLPVLCIIRRE